MPTVDEILSKAGDEFVNDLRKQFTALGLNDTHKAEKALSSSVSKGTLKIDGLLRTVVLITGRKNGKFPPLEPIEKWAIRKLGVDEKEAKGIAFVIARKIAKKGTDIYTGKSKGLQIELIINDINKDLQEKVNEEIALGVTESVLNAYE